MDFIPIDQLVRSRRRTVALVITAEATLTVRAPLYTPLATIESFVRERESWIRQKIDQVRSRPQLQVMSFEEGAEFRYLGRSCPLEIDDGATIRCGDKLYFPRTLLPQAREEMLFWYRQEARRVITERTEYYAALMGIRYDSIELSNAGTRWGSCSYTGGLRFSWRLIMAPLEVLDYVVVHELAHVLVRDHSRRFWNKVREFCPHSSASRLWLKKHNRLIEYG